MTETKTKALWTMLPVLTKETATRSAAHDLVDCILGQIENGPVEVRVDASLILAAPDVFVDEFVRRILDDASAVSNVVICSASGKLAAQFAAAALCYEVAEHLSIDTHLEEALGIDLDDLVQAVAGANCASDGQMWDDLIAIRKQTVTTACVAERLGMSEADVQRIENERDPHLSTLRRYALAVDVIIEHRVHRANDLLALGD